MTTTEPLVKKRKQFRGRSFRKGDQIKIAMARVHEARRKAKLEAQRIAMSEAAPVVRAKRPMPSRDKRSEDQKKADLRALYLERSKKIPCCLECGMVGVWRSKHCPAHDSQFFTKPTKNVSREAAL